MRFFMQGQDFEVGFSNVSAICINQARNQIFFGKIFVELGYFSKHLLKTQEKRPCREKLWSFFSCILLKLHSEFSCENNEA